MLSDKEHGFEYCILDLPLPVDGYVARLTLTPVTVGDRTLGVWVAEGKMTDQTEADVSDLVANGTFGLAFKVLNDRLAG